MPFQTHSTCLEPELLVCHLRLVSRNLCRALSGLINIHLWQDEDEDHNVLCDVPEMTFCIVSVLVQPVGEEWCSK